MIICHHRYSLTTGVGSYSSASTFGALMEFSFANLLQRSIDMWTKVGHCPNPPDPAAALQLMLAFAIVIPF